MSKKKNIDWNTIDNQMKNLTTPLSFIYTIIKLQDKIDDYNLSLIIRFFIKNQIELSMKYPLFIMINMLNDEFIITKKVVNEYYSSILKKFIFLETIMKFKSSFTKEKFWDKDIVSQKNILENLLLIFRAHFEASFNGVSGVTKFASQLKFKSNPIIMEEIKNRLSSTIQLFGPAFFINNNIKILKLDEFESLNITEQVKFIVYYFLKTEKCIRIMINVFELLLIYDNKIKQIINPKPIYINFNRIYSETDSDDLELLMTYQ